MLGWDFSTTLDTPFRCSLLFPSRIRTKRSPVRLQTRQCGYPQNSMSSTVQRKMHPKDYMHFPPANLLPSNRWSKRSWLTKQFELPRSKLCWQIKIHCTNLIFHKGIGIGEQKYSRWNLLSRCKGRYLPLKYQKNCKGNSQLRWRKSWQWGLECRRRQSGENHWSHFRSSCRQETSLVHKS